MRFNGGSVAGVRVKLPQWIIKYCLCCWIFAYRHVVTVLNRICVNLWIRRGTAATRALLVSVVMLL